MAQAEPRRAADSPTADPALPDALPTPLPGIWQQLLDSLSAHVAVLDDAGHVIAVNDAWMRLARRRGDRRDWLGTDYIELCHRAETPAARRMAAGIRALLAGERDQLELDYCSGAVGELRWFRLRARRLAGAVSARAIVAFEPMTQVRRLQQELADQRRVIDELGAAFIPKPHRLAGPVGRREVRGDARAWVARLQEALVEDRFVLYGQPIVNVRSGETVQRELLIRMHDQPPSSLVPPSRFLPAAEGSGLITEIDRWVVQQAARMAAAGRRAEVNVSARSIQDPGFVDHICAALDRAGAHPEDLVFEITETSLASADTTARSFADALHSLGCRLALDDFGTGYSGFTYLKHLPFDFLKIDMEFVRDLPDNQASRRVVQAVVELARGFDMSTIAEGVEDGPTLELLAELGVDHAQGFHIGHPSPIELDDDPAPSPA